MEKIKAMNTAEFKALAKRYADITLYDIEKAEISINLREELHYDTYGGTIAYKLTKFGSEDCTLCQALGVAVDCVYCHWYTEAGIGCGYDKTYRNIYRSKNKKELLAAFKARSVYMYQFIDKK